MAISGYLKGGSKAPAIIIVFEENNDNNKGKKVLDEQWIQRDETIEISTTRGRIIYDYKYNDADSWKPDNHASVSGGEDSATLIP